MFENKFHFECVVEYWFSTKLACKFAFCFPADASPRFQKLTLFPRKLWDMQCDLQFSVYLKKATVKLKALLWCCVPFSILQTKSLGFVTCLQQKHNKAKKKYEVFLRKFLGESAWMRDFAFGRSKIVLKSHLRLAMVLSSGIMLFLLAYVMKRLEITITEGQYQLSSCHVDSTWDLFLSANHEK